MLERQEILKLAKLSRLELSDADIVSVSSHLGKMLQHMESLRALDLSAVEPMTGAEDAATVLRPDVIEPSFTHEQAFLNAPQVDSGHFVMPKVMGA
jgi:aspartyl-tRNA(Asn)/glutamyl-tRNA(Gln) amidotransferase subunit C